MKIDFSAPPQPGKNGRGIVLMLAAILCFTLMDATVKGLVDRYPAPMLVWFRFIGQLIFVLILLGRRTGLHLRTRFPGIHIARAATQIGATVLFFTSLRYIGLAEATALADINPVLITLGAAVFLGERLGPRRVFGVIVALIGALIVIRPGAGVFSPAALLPLACAACYAGNALLTRWIGPLESIWTAMLISSVLCSIAVTLTLPFFWVPILLSDLPTLALIGALGTTAQFCIVRSLTLAEASAVAPFAYVGILFAAIWGIIFFDSYPDRWTVIGALVIVAAGLYVWHRETRAARVQDQAG